MGLCKMKSKWFEKFDTKDQFKPQQKRQNIPVKLKNAKKHHDQIILFPCKPS